MYSNRFGNDELRIQCPLPNVTCLKSRMKSWRGKLSIVSVSSWQIYYMNRSFHNVKWLFELFSTHKKHKGIERKKRIRDEACIVQTFTPTNSTVTLYFFFHHMIVTSKIHQRLLLYPPYLFASATTCNQHQTRWLPSVASSLGLGAKG